MTASMKTADEADRRSRSLSRKQLARLEQATKYDFLWHKAHKRIEIRDLPGFGEIAALAPFPFAHLAVDVYPVMRHALDFFATRILPGSLIVVDDYGFVTCRGTRQAVDEFVASHPNYRFFHLLTGQALLVRLQ